MFVFTEISQGLSINGRHYGTGAIAASITTGLLVHKVSKNSSNVQRDNYQNLNIHITSKHHTICIPQTRRNHIISTFPDKPTVKDDSEDSGKTMQRISG